MESFFQFIAPWGSPLFVSFVLIGTMIVLNLVIGVIMNSMDESNAEMSVKQEIERRKKQPEPVRDSLHDLQSQMEELTSEIKVIKKMIEETNPSSR